MKTRPKIAMAAMRANGKYPATPQSGDRRRGVQTGFTLVELLVVIAILAILASLLFPVLAGAKEKAKQASSLSNLRQLGVATFLYCADFDEQLPQYLNDEEMLLAYDPQVTASAMPTDSAHPLLLKEALRPYCKSEDIWYAAADRSARRAYGGMGLNNLHASYVRRALPQEVLSYELISDYIADHGWPILARLNQLVGSEEGNGVLFLEPVSGQPGSIRSYYSAPVSLVLYEDGRVAPFKLH